MSHQTLMTAEGIEEFASNRRRVLTKVMEQVQLRAPPLTLAQRQALWRQRKAQHAEAWRKALERIATAATVTEARRLATEALES